MRAGGVTVIIPCFNDGNYLEEALQSVGQCGIPTDNIIVVNDGSTDPETLEILHLLEHKQSATILHQSNRGLAAARNAGVQACQTEFFIPLDADNRLRPELFREGLNALNAHPEAAFAYTDCLEFGDRKGLRQPGPFEPLRLLEGNYIDACALIRRRVWEEVGGYDETMRLGYEDWEFWLHLLDRGQKGLYIPVCGFEYRVRSDSLLQITNQDENRRNILRYILRKHEKLYQRYATELVPLLMYSRLEYELQHRALRITLTHEKNLALHELAQAWEGRLHKEKEELTHLLREKWDRERLALQEELSRRTEEFRLTVQHYNNLLEALQREKEKWREDFSAEKHLLQNHIDRLQAHVASLNQHLQNLDEQFTQLAQREQHHLRHIESLKNLVQQLQDRVARFEASLYYRLGRHWQRFKNLLRSGERKGGRAVAWLQRIAFMLSAEGRRIIRRFFKKVFRALYLMLEEQPVTILVGPNALVTGSVPQEPYAHWRQLNDPRPADLKMWKEEVLLWPYRPLISILVPVYNTPLRFLEELVQSIQQQIYTHWELCIADDASTDKDLRAYLQRLSQSDERIKVVWRSQNGHISRCTNSALEIASGEFCALVDHDDLLAPDALFHVVRTLNLHPATDLIYTDEDKITEEGHRFMPHFKPQWCPDSFLSRNYMGHLVVVRTQILRDIGGFRIGFEGSQDYDMLLRFTERTTRIQRIPRVLYHWRVHSRSAAASEEAKPYAYMAARKALLEALDRRGEPADIDYLPGFRGYDIKFRVVRPGRVAIIIPAHNKADVTAVCLKSIFEKTTYQDFVVHLLSNNSTERALFRLAEEWQKKQNHRFKFHECNYPFNFSRLVNDGVRLSEGDYLLLLNNDTEVIHGDWLERLVAMAQRPSVGCVGCKLIYPNGTIQHAGVIVGLGGAAGHAFTHIPQDAPGYFNYIQSINNYSAVTAACLMVRRAVFEEVGGFDEDFSVEYNDVDFCLRVREAGYHNVYVPHVVLYHHESLTRGHPHLTGVSYALHLKEIGLFKKRWQKYIDDDPCYSPNLSLGHHDFSLRLHP
ncbi:MAG: glycosyltransferase [Flavobacteriales bacterium]|nr:glycosyltransferase [Flavobacteriales bacterium]MDW8410616.1 glycosyltransferase [Flavobacteriales bacterium]